MSKAKKPIKHKDAFDYAAIFDEICASMASGNTLKSTARDMGFSIGAFYDWLGKDENKSFDDRIHAARFRQAEVWSDEIISDASDTSVDPARSRLIVDTKKWLLARNHAARFGDKIESTVKGDKDSPLVITWLPAQPKPGP